MIAHSVQPRWLPGTHRPHPLLTALINTVRLALAAPLALIAAMLLPIGLVFALAVIALHPSLGRLLSCPWEEAGSPGEVGRNRDGGHHDERQHDAVDRAAHDLRLPPMPRRPYRPRLVGDVTPA